MTFEDLPPNWTTLPLSAPNLAADVVDLVLSEAFRAEDTLLFLPCDDHDVGYPTPVVVGDIDWLADDQQRREMVEALASLEVPSAVVGVSSAHRLRADVVHRWHTDALDAFCRTGTRLLGFFSAWPHNVKPAAVPDRLPDDGLIPGSSMSLRDVE